MASRDKIPPGQLKKILAYNQNAREKAEKASAGETLAQAITALPPGQRKKLLTDQVLEALAILGVTL